MDFYVNTATRKLVVGLDEQNTSTPDAWVQGEVLPVRIFFLLSDDAATAAPWFTVLDVSNGYTVVMGACVTPIFDLLNPDLIASQTSFEDITDPAIGKSGYLSINSSELDDQIATLGHAIATGEITLTDEGTGEIIKCQFEVEVKAAVVDEANPLPLDQPTAFTRRAAPVSLTVLDGQTNSNTVVVSGILQADLIVQALAGDGTEAPRVKRWSVNENPDDPTLNTLECELDAPATGTITIYAMAYRNV